MRGIGTQLTAWLLKGRSNILNYLKIALNVLAIVIVDLKKLGHITSKLLPLFFDVMLTFINVFSEDR